MAVCLKLFYSAQSFFVWDWHSGSGLHSVLTPLLGEGGTRTCEGDRRLAPWTQGVTESSGNRHMPEFLLPSKINSNNISKQTQNEG